MRQDLEAFDDLKRPAELFANLLRDRDVRAPSEQPPAACPERNEGLGAGFVGQCLDVTTLSFWNK